MTTDQGPCYRCGRPEAEHVGGRCPVEPQAEAQGQQLARGSYPPPGGPPAYLPASYAPGQPAHQRVQPRPRWIGAVVSLFIPGVGSMLNGSALRGGLIFGAWVLSWLLTLVLIGLILLPAVWIWGIIDGALSADRWNRAHGIIS